MTELWSVNRLAAQAVALHGSAHKHVEDDPSCRHCAEALEMLEMLGLVAPDRTIVPVDNRFIEMGGVEASPVERASMTIREPGADRSLVPAGLRDLLPYAEQPKIKPKAPAVNRCGTLTGGAVHARNGEKLCRACKDARNAYTRKRRREQNKCGTLAGRSVHVRAGEQVCPSCADVYNAHQRAKRKAKRLSLPRELSNCGTTAGRSVHMRAGEQVCTSCSDAYSAHQRALRKAKRPTQVDEVAKSA